MRLLRCICVILAAIPPALRPPRSGNSLHTLFRPLRDRPAVVPLWCPASSILRLFDLRPRSPISISDIDLRYRPSTLISDFDLRSRSNRNCVARLWWSRRAGENAEWMTWEAFEEAFQADVRHGMGRGLIEGLVTRCGKAFVVVTHGLWPKTCSSVFCSCFVFFHIVCVWLLAFTYHVQLGFVLRICDVCTNIGCCEVFEVICLRCFYVMCGNISPHGSLELES